MLSGKSSFAEVLDLNHSQTMASLGLMKSFWLVYCIGGEFNFEINNYNHCMNVLSTLTVIDQASVDSQTKPSVSDHDWSNLIRFKRPS